VGGNSILPMEDLADILADLGGQSVKTYIQSGNAVYRYEAGDVSELSTQITIEVERRRGFSPKVLILTPAELDQAMTENPFPEAEADPSCLHLGFLAASPTGVNFEKLESLRTANEQFRQLHNVFYLYAPDGVGKSKLAAGAEKILGVDMADRNWRTVCKIREMVNQY
jgi:uncharacterized protein (DUF1697 family)